VVSPLPTGRSPEAHQEQIKKLRPSIEYFAISDDSQPSSEVEDEESETMEVDVEKEVKVRGDLNRSQELEDMDSDVLSVHLNSREMESLAAEVGLDDEGNLSPQRDSRGHLIDDLLGDIDQFEIDAPDQNGRTGPDITISGPQRLPQGKEAFFTIVAKYVDGTPAYRGDDDRIMAEVIGPGSTLIACTLIDNADGTYSGSFQPLGVGRHDVVVRLNGVYLEATPYSCVVKAGVELGVSIVRPSGSDSQVNKSKDTRALGSSLRSIFFGSPKSQSASSPKVPAKAVSSSISRAAYYAVSDIDG
jgi:hypothetical protein